MPGRVEGRGHPPGVERELAGEDVVDHLAPLAEGGLDQPPELVLGLGVEAVVRGVRLDDDDRRFDRGLGLERAPAARAKAIRTRAWYWTKTDR